MNIEVGKIIYYNDVIDNAASQIKNICENIDSYKNVPADLKNGELYEVVHHSDHATNEFKSNKATTDVTLSCITQDSRLKIVASSVVNEQLESFFSARGINKNQKTGKVITAKGIINFYNNLAIFIYHKVKCLRSSIDNSYLFFYQDEAIIEEPGISDTSPQTYNLSYSEMNQGYDQLIKAFNKVNTTPQNVIVNYSSSSSSSSSSCSCSSSSSCSSCSCCSCSSSTYIVYMLIP